MSGSSTNDDTSLLEAPLSSAEARVYEERLSGLLDALGHVVDRVEADFLRRSDGEPGRLVDESMGGHALGQELRALAVGDELGYEASRALERIREGTFGSCVTCGERISRARLQLVPYARLCSACARKRD